MDLDTALAWAAGHSHAVLITLRSDGRAQSSDIAYAIADRSFRVSVTADRAKTVNMRRDRRVVLHVTDPARWSYASFDGVAELSPVASDPDDATCDELVRYYEAVAGKPHDDWAEYRRAMVRERRMIATIRPATVTGQINT